MKKILFLLISFCCYPALSQDLSFCKSGKKHKLKITLNVPDHVLPPPGQWKYDLDIWLNPAGSLFQFYPGPRSSIRFEKIIEGVQASEKIRILKDQFISGGNFGKLKELEGILTQFELGKLDSIPASQMVESAKSKINKF
jgi:hypothetical protein